MRWDWQYVVEDKNPEASMSESRSNHNDQVGMAILAVVLFAVLFVVVGGFGWFFVRSQRARREAELMQAEQARYEAEAQRRRVEAELAEHNGD